MVPGFRLGPKCSVRRTELPDWDPKVPKLGLVGAKKVPSGESFRTGRDPIWIHFSMFAFDPLYKT